jgi:ergothioneine biosynthesis protein EgtB
VRAPGIPIRRRPHIDSVEPIYGLVAIGLVDPRNLKRNAGAKAGDQLVLGKAHRRGIHSAALKKGRLDDAGYKAMIATTTKLNTPGTRLGEIAGVHALTDVTGFGLLGPPPRDREGLGMGARLDWKAIPLLPDAVEFAREGIVTGASARNWSGYGARVKLGAGNRGSGARDPHRPADERRPAGGLRAVHMRRGARSLSLAGLRSRRRRGRDRRGPRGGGGPMIPSHAPPHGRERCRSAIAACARKRARWCPPLSAEDCAVQSMTDASPAKWHLAHTTWFFETFVLSRHDPGRPPFDKSYRYLFNSYYNAVGDRHPRPQRGLLTRPALEEVLAYRDQVDAALLELLDRGALEPALRALVELGTHHEQQHQELILTDVKHLFSRNPQRPTYQKNWPLTPIHRPAREWIGFGAGARQIGHEGDGFAFDNETPRHTTWLHDFEIASHPVTHGEFLRFIEDDGYRRPELWLSAGWDAVQAHGWKAPLYWEEHDGEWQTFTLHGMAPIEPNTPVCHVSFYEAEAFARWADARLPTEAEWEIAAVEAPTEGNFLESGALHPLAPRDAAPGGRMAQAFGDVWEWTRSDYSPYPRFRPAPGAVGEYNGKFMCNHYVLRGGSCATPSSHIRASYRNFFPAEARWQFSGLRLARDA